MSKQVVEPEISRKKFDREVAEFHQIAKDWRQKGVICLKADFPFVELAFISNKLKPSAVAFAVSIDFTDYDVVPPSIVFIDVLSGEKITAKEMSVGFFQTSESQQREGLPPQLRVQQRQPILMGRADDYPFLCIPGVREYHKHPAHTGNPWLLHRTKGEGRLCFLIDQLYIHSMPFITGFNISMSISVKQF